MSLYGAVQEQESAPSPLLFNNIGQYDNPTRLFQTAVILNHSGNIKLFFPNLVAQFQGKYGNDLFAPLQQYLFNFTKHVVKTCTLETLLCLFNLKCGQRRLLAELSKDQFITLMKKAPDLPIFIYFLGIPPDLNLQDLLPHLDDMSEQKIEAIIKTFEEEEIEIAEGPDSDDDIDCDERHRQRKRTKLSHS